jgi:hypothetical protein
MKGGFQAALFGKDDYCNGTLDRFKSKHTLIPVRESFQSLSF